MHFMQLRVGRDLPYTKLGVSDDIRDATAQDETRPLQHNEPDIRPVHPHVLYPRTGLRHGWETGPERTCP